MAYGDNYPVPRWRDAKHLRLMAQNLLEVAAEAEVLEERFGTNDDWPEGAVISWDRTFQGSRRYTYIALKSGGRWYVTGKQGNQCNSMQQMIERHLQYADDGMIFQVSGWEEV